MTCIAQVASTGGAGIPSIYKGVVTTCLDCPRVGVEVVVTTDTHLVEFCGGLVLRSCRIGNRETVSRIRVLQGEMPRNWIYLLEGGGKLVFLRGKDLSTLKEYTEVEEADTGDFLKTGRRMVKIRLADGEVILTDGITEFDLDQELSEEDKVDAPGRSVSMVLEQRLSITREAVVRARAELEMTTKLVEDAMKEFMVSCAVDEILELRGVDELARGKEKLEEEMKGLVVKGYWTKLMRDDLVIGFELETVGGEVSNVELQLVTNSEEVEYSYYVLRRTRRGDSLFVKKVTNFGVEGVCVKGTLVAKVPFNCINTSITNTLKASVSFNLAPHSRRLHTHTSIISLHPLDFCSNTMSPSFESTKAISSFFSAFLTGIREILKVTTQLGSLQSLPSLLPKLNFTLTDTIAGYLIDSPSNPLHLSILMMNPVNSRQVEVIMYAKDYTHLALLVRMLREVLPADAEFERVEEEDDSLCLL